MNPGELACYLYCLTHGGGGGEVSAALPGVDDLHPVRLRDCGGIAAVYSQVELEEFVGPAAEARLQDLAWLGPRVCRHEAVIEQAMSRAPVLPARFATLFISLESLDRFADRHRSAIAGFFRELGDRQEWAVKGRLNRAVALSGALDGALKGLNQPAAGEPAYAPGARYFEQKRIKVQAEREFSQRLREFCQRAAADLGTQAGGFRERKALADEGDEVVLNWAFLLAPAEIVNFRATLERMNGGAAFPGLRLTMTGPWPPFSFTPDLAAGTPE